MKKMGWLLGGCLLVAAMAAHAEFLAEDVRVVRLDAVYDDEAGGDSTWGGELGFGVAVLPRFEMGLIGQLSENDVRNFRMAGLYMEESLHVWGPLYPFLGIGAGYAWTDIKGGDNESSGLGRVTGGLKVAFNDRWALAASVMYYVALEDIFPQDSATDLIDRHVQFSLGLRFCY